MSPIKILSIFAATAPLMCSAAFADVFTVTYGEPAAQTPASAALCAGASTCIVGTETFSSQPVTGGASGASFTTDYGTNGAITGTYSGSFGIQGANIYGGAGGAGNYISTSRAGGYTIDLIHDASTPGINYFGFWLSALDAGNGLEVLRNGVVVGTYMPADLLAAVGSNPAYFGNPNNGGDASEPFAFVNFFDTTGFFDQIHIFQGNSRAGYESDNHTVAFRDVTSTPGNTIPEPAGLGLIAVGGSALVALRGRRTGRRPTALR